MNRVYSDKTPADLRAWIELNVESSNKANGAAQMLAMASRALSRQLAGYPIGRQQAALMDALDQLRELRKERAAALGLVPSKEKPGLHQESNPLLGEWQAWIDGVSYGWGPTPAIALCIAALEAREYLETERVAA